MTFQHIRRVWAALSRKDSMAELMQLYSRNPEGTRWALDALLQAGYIEYRVVIPLIDIEGRST